MRLCLALLLLLHASIATCQAPPSPEDLAAIDAVVADRMRAHAIPGVALAITHGGELIHARGFGSDGRGGPMTADTPMYIGSVSKSFTGLAVMQLVDAGHLELDVPVRTYLPWFDVAEPCR
jgi:CubicO group peptidase (beta-lactamase class C family)